MDAGTFLDMTGVKFFTGVPDSLLRGLCDCLMERYGVDGVHHVIAANEGNAVALAAGYHLATGCMPLVYLQNSGIGNIINPVASLLSIDVYAIPCLFVIGWRGEPGVKDEHQHIFQGKVTESMLKASGIKYQIIGPSTTVAETAEMLYAFHSLLTQGKQCAFLVRKGALTFAKQKYVNNNILMREEILNQILTAAGSDIIVCTTGKASRELFELRERRGEGHEHDFLTVGSMGHASSITLGIALQMPERRIWCIDGDGAALMHMGAMAVIGSSGVNNLVHVVVNNESHESVGGQPTVAGKISFASIANACGYRHVFSVSDLKGLYEALNSIADSVGSCFLDVKSSMGSREDLGRPKSTPQGDKRDFMNICSRKVK